MTRSPIRSSQRPAVWNSEGGSSESVVLEWPKTKVGAGNIVGAFYSRFYGASWCPWVEEIFLTTARRQSYVGHSSNSVVAIDASSGSVVADMTGDLCHSSYLIECHNTRPEVVVANSAGPGYLASFRFSQQQA